MHIVALLLLLLLALIFGPQLWVRRMMARHSKPLDHLPGTGSELARHLLNRFGMADVTVEITEQGDHYDPMDKAVRLSPANYHGKSLTAVAVAAHEVGHAIQDRTGHPLLQARTRLVGMARTAERLGAGAMVAIPVIAVATKAPAAGFLLFLAGFVSLATAAVVHLVTLPVEWDASFGKALPILTEGQYVSAAEERAVRGVLRAAALTYVAASLASLLNLGRWLAILLRR